MQGQMIEPFDERRGNSATRSAFSLVELLVVMAVIALAAGVLLPVLSRVRDSGNSLSCQANVRRIVNGVLAYTMDNKGSMPYGFYWRVSDPVTWEPARDADRASISWVSLIDPYLGDGTPNPPGQFSPLFRCPEAQLVAPHPVSYVMNMIVAVSPREELRIGGVPPRAQLKPAKLNLMLEDGTALLWDTAIGEPGLNGLGYLIGADIDGQRFWNGAHTPQYRYYSPHDPFGQFPGGWGNNHPVRLTVGGITYRNIDPPAGSSYPYQGNLRFRHDGQTHCNVGMSDGSVTQFRAVIGTNNSVTTHNAIRRQFMIHWPPGVTPGPGPY